MTELLYLAPLGAILVAAFVYLGRLEPSLALRLWLLGFGALLAGALCMIPNTPAGWAATSVFSSAFVALMYAGARSFAERPVPLWVAPLALAVGVPRAFATLHDWPGPMSVVAGAYAIGLLGLAGHTLWRYSSADGAGLAERMLGPAMAGLGVLLGISIGVRFIGIHGGGLFAVWISAAGVVCVLQVLAGLERTQGREWSRQQELEQERRTLRAVIETAPVDIVLRDDDGTIRMTNRSAAERFGIALGPNGDPVPGQAWPGNRLDGSVAFAGPVDGPGAAPDDRAGASEAESLEVFTQPVVGDAGESLGRLWIARDVTQERHLQQQLVQSQKMETLGTLAGGVAHDFNNQLTTIVGNARLMGDHIDRDPALVRECLRDLETAADHCAELTQGLLAFARRAPSSREPVGVASVLAQVGSLLRATLPRRIALRVEPTAADDRVIADATQLKQVLLNLAINARDAIHGAGTIRIATRDVRLAAPRTTAGGTARPGRYVEFRVEDTGVGIDPRCRTRVFDPFFTTKPTGEGTGLGLAIAYGVVQAHDGYIDLESEPGRTVLRVGIPAVVGQRAAAAPEATRAPRGAGETLLLADDEPSLRRLLRGQLERAGYRVLEADSGEAAIELAARPDRKIDGAVLDLSMPGIDGLETLDALRSARPGLPGLIISGFVDAAAEHRLADAAALLQKPFDDEALARAVRRMLDA